MGEEGYLGADQPEEYGGAGADFLYDAIIMEELAYTRAHALQASLHTDICLPYLTSYASEAQKQKYLAPGHRGGLSGGDRDDRAQHRLRSGRRADPRDPRRRPLRRERRQDVHLERPELRPGDRRGEDRSRRSAPRRHQPAAGRGDTPGFERGRNLEKIGLKGQDTSELFFRDCRVPVENLLGEEGQGFKMLMEKLQQERLCIAVGSHGFVSRRSLDDTLAYVKEREAFGKPIGAFQNTQFKLAELATEYEIGQAFVDKLLAAHVRGEDIVSEVSMAKWWTTDLQKRSPSECLQLHGGYGFMSEYPISTDYADAAVQSIYAGTNEIMKVITPASSPPAGRHRRVSGAAGGSGRPGRSACSRAPGRRRRRRPGSPRGPRGRGRGSRRGRPQRACS